MATISMHAVLDEQAAEVKKLCEQFHVAKLEAFGSVLKEDFNPESSDIDFLIEFDNQGRLNYADNFFGLQKSLEDLFGQAIELVVESAVSNPYFKKNINSTKAMIYEAGK